MKAIKRKKKVKGTVLFTVVAVMMVMVVFLMSTLVLTTAAQKRTYYTYFEKQAQYAAQSALDTISEMLFGYQKQDGDDLPEDSFYDWVKSIDATPQDLVLEYKPANNSGTSSSILGLDDDGSGNSNRVNCRIEKVSEPAVFWNSTYNRMQIKEQWKITATAVVGEGRNRAEYTLCNYIVDNHETAQNQLPTMGQSSQNLQLTRFTPNTTTTSKTNPTAVGYSVYSFTPSAFSSADNMVVCGARMSGSNHYPSVVLNNNMRQYTDADDTIIRQRQNDVISVAQQTFIGSMKDNTNPQIFFQQPQEGFVVYGDYKPNPNVLTVNAQLKNAPTDYKSINYIYVDGLFDADKVTVNANQPVNWYLGAVSCDNKDAAYNWKSKGDIYLYDPYLSSDLKFEGTTKLLNFTSANITKSSGSANGSIVCNNQQLTLNVDQNGTTIEGDLYFTNPNGTLTINNGGTKGLTVKGNFYCAGTLNGTVNADKTLTVDQVSKTGYPTNYTSELNRLLAGKQGGTWAKVPDFRGIPYDSRKDQIFEKYVRWDLGCATEAEAQAYISGAGIDYEIAESIAAGHEWKVTSYEVDAVNGGLKYFPYTTPSSNRSDTWFINDLKLVKAADYITSYSTSLEDFKTKEASGSYPVDDKGREVVFNPQAASKQSVGVYCHDKNGNATIETLSDAYVITGSTVFDLSKLGDAETNIFIDPTKRTDITKPIVIVLKGYKSNGLLTIVSNNTANYPNGYNVTSPTQVDSFHDLKINAGLDEVLFFFAQDTIPHHKYWDGDSQRFDSNVANKMSILCSGVYSQYKGNEYNVVGSPYYPSHPDFDTVDKSFRYAYELVPNISIYGKKDGAFACENGAVYNAIIKMPASKLVTKAGETSQNATVHYREFPDSVSADVNKYNVVGLGSVTVEELIGENKATYMYLADMNRTSSSNTIITPGFENPNKTDLQLTDPGYGDFIVDHQGAN